MLISQNIFTRGLWKLCFGKIFQRLGLDNTIVKSTVEGCKQQIKSAAKYVWLNHILYLSYSKYRNKGKYSNSGYAGELIKMSAFSFSLTTQSLAP